MARAKKLLSFDELIGEAPLKRRRRAAVVDLKPEEYHGEPSGRPEVAAGPDGAADAGATPAPEQPPALPDTLPAHSALGGSSAERYIACPGSVELIAQIRATQIPEEDPEYRKEGVLAHQIAEFCLRTGRDPAEVMILDPVYEAVTADIADAVQVYLRYVRSLGGDKEFEVRVAAPEVDAAYYGQIDTWRADEDEVETIDYKNGAGVIVSPAENPQLMFYTGAKIGLEATGLYPDDLRVKLTIVQPNAFGVDPIRSWATTTGFIRAWMRNVLIPAMRRTREDKYLDVGSHCRFCPAKIICPAQTELVKTYATLHPDMMQLLPDPSLKRLCERIEAGAAMIKAIKAEAYRRLMAGADPETIGMKLVEGKVNRAWKADAPVEAQLGEVAYIRKLVSPAQAEKLGTAGKALVREWAHKPPGMPQVVLLSNDRRAIERKDVMSTFAKFAGQLPEDTDVGF